MRPHPRRSLQRRHRPRRLATTTPRPESRSAIVCSMRDSTLLGYPFRLICPDVSVRESRASSQQMRKFLSEPPDKSGREIGTTSLYVSFASAVPLQQTSQTEHRTTISRHSQIRFQLEYQICAERAIACASAGKLVKTTSISTRKACF